MARCVAGAQRSLGRSETVEQLCENPRRLLELAFNKGAAGQINLVYVACTRARSQLFLPTTLSGWLPLAQRAAGLAASSTPNAHHTTA